MAYLAKPKSGGFRAGSGLPPELEVLQGDERARFFLKWWLEMANKMPGSLWNSSVIKYFTILSTSVDGRNARITIGLTVQPEHCQVYGELAGGCIASILDDASALLICLVASPSFWKYNGTSRDLNTTYYRSAGPGTELLIEGIMMHIGASLGRMRLEVRTKKEGKLVASGEHQVFNIDPFLSAKL